MELDLAMRKLLATIALSLLSSSAWAQCTGVFPPNTLCGNLSGSPAPPAAFTSAGTVVGPGASTVGHIATWLNNVGSQLNDTASIITNQTLSLTNATASTSPTTGALLVTGGVGVSANLFTAGSQTVAEPSGSQFGHGVRLTGDSQLRGTLSLDANDVGYLAFGTGNNTTNNVFIFNDVVGTNRFIGIGGRTAAPASGSTSTFGGLNVYGTADVLPNPTNFVRAVITAGGLTQQVGGNVASTSMGITQAPVFNANNGNPGSAINLSTSYVGPGPPNTVTTIDNATPTVVTTATNHHYLLGMPLYFTGTLPTGLSNNTTYYVHSTGAKTFNIATSGANIITPSYIGGLTGAASGATAVPGCVATITLANPAVISCVNGAASADFHGMVPGQAIIFCSNVDPNCTGTSDTLPAHIVAGTTYYVQGGLAPAAGSSTDATPTSFTITTTQLGITKINTSADSQSGTHVFYIDSTKAAPVGGQFQMFNIASISDNSGQIFWNQTLNSCCKSLDSVGIFGSVEVIAAPAALTIPIFYLQTIGAGIQNPATGCTPGVSCFSAVQWSIDIAGRTIIDTGYSVNGADQVLLLQGGTNTGNSNYVFANVRNHSFPGPNCMAGYSIADNGGGVGPSMFGWSQGDCTTKDLVFTNGNPGNIGGGTTGFMDMLPGRIQIRSGAALSWATNNAPCFGEACGGAASTTGISQYTTGVVAVGNGSPGDDSGTLRASGFISNSVTGVDCLSGVTAGTVVVHKGIVTHC
jgi:hypothetical protein